MWMAVFCDGTNPARCLTGVVDAWCETEHVREARGPGEPIDGPDPAGQAQRGQVAGSGNRLDELCGGVLLGATIDLLIQLLDLIVQGVPTLYGKVEDEPVCSGQIDLVEPSPNSPGVELLGGAIVHEVEASHQCLDLVDHLRSSLATLDASAGDQPILAIILRRYHDLADAVKSSSSLEPVSIDPEDLRQSCGVTPVGLVTLPLEGLDEDGHGALVGLQSLDEPVGKSAFFDDGSVATSLLRLCVYRSQELVDGRRLGGDGGATKDVAGLVEQDDGDLRLVQVNSEM